MADSCVEELMESWYQEVVPEEDRNRVTEQARSNHDRLLGIADKPLRVQLKEACEEYQQFDLKSRKLKAIISRVKEILEEQSNLRNPDEARVRDVTEKLETAKKLEKKVVGLGLGLGLGLG